MALNAVSHFTFLSISEQAGGLNVVPIPAQGDKGRIISVMGGNSDITTCAWAAAAPYVKSGDIKVLGMATRERSVFAPEIPTLKEQGYDVHCIFLYSMEAPKGTPPEVLKALGDAYKKAVESPRTQEALRNQSIQPYFMGPEATRAHWQEEAGLYEELAKKNKLIE
jgi:tripartite-type tricarboxylate transporter receptor subunit TctC